MQNLLSKSKLRFAIRKQSGNVLKSIFYAATMIMAGLSIFSFSASTDSSQEISPKITNTQSFIFLGEGFTAPQWVSGGNSELLVTKKGFKGLYHLDYVANESTQLTDAYSAGYNYYQLDNGLVITKFANLDNSEKSGFRRTEGINVLSLNQGKSLYNKEFNSSRIILPKPYIDKGEWRIAAISNEKNQTVNYDISKMNHRSGFFNSNLVYYSRDGIVINIDGEKKLLTNEYSIDPVVSPNGEYLCFNDRGTLKVMDKEFEVFEVGAGVNATWEPNSEYLVFQQTIDDGESIITSDLYSFNIKTRKLIQLTNTPDILEEYPSISNDRKKIVFTDMQRGLIHVGDIKF